MISIKNIHMKNLSLLFLIFLFVMCNPQPENGGASDGTSDPETENPSDPPEYDPFMPKPPKIEVPQVLPKITLPVENSIIVWLGQNKEVSQHLIWYEEEKGWVPWSEWSPGMKGLLQDAYQFALNGSSIPSIEPVQNHVVRKDNEAPVSIFSFEDARNLFFSQVAWSILIDVQQKVQWSLSDLDDYEIELIFDGRTYFEEELGCTYPNGSWDPSHKYCSFKGLKLRFGALQPAPGHWTYGLLLANNLVGSTRKETIRRVCIWVTENFSHYVGPNNTANMEAIYDSRGQPPLVNIVGTESLPTVQKLKPMYACWGATNFLKILLAQVNIPVEYNWVPGHAIPRFPSEGIALSHGDDLYNRNIRSSLPSAFTYDEIFINDSVFQSWFGEHLTPIEKSRNAGRNIREIAVKHLTISIISRYCNDLEAGNSIPESEVYDYLKYTYTLEELGEMMLWQKLEAKLETLEYGCDELSKY